MPKTADLSTLLSDCARIYRLFGMEFAQEKTLALFKQSPEAQFSPDGLVQRILEAARELKQSIVEGGSERLQISREQAVELTGRLYELAIAQSEPPRRDDLIREITFFYLVSGKSESFLEWSRKLLDLVQTNSDEHRATLFALGLAQIFVGEPAQAELTFHRLLFAFPKSREGYFGLALAYLKLGNIVQVEKMLDQIRDEAPELARIVDRLGEIEDFTSDDYAAELDKLDDSQFS